MVRRVSLVVLLLAALSLGCRTVQPADPLVVEAISVERDLFQKSDAFVRLEHAELYALVPGAAEAANRVRSTYPKAIRDLRSARRAYMGAQTPLARAKLVSEMEQARTLITEVESWLRRLP